jgi:hypothetical protein
LLLDAGAQIGGVLWVEGFCDELLVGTLAFVVGAAEAQEEKGVRFTSQDAC